MPHEPVRHWLLVLGALLVYAIAVSVVSRPFANNQGIASMAEVKVSASLNRKQVI